MAISSGEYPIRQEYFQIRGPYPKDLYHYTDLEGMLGILENESLWFTDAQYLNDPQEQRYFSWMVDDYFKEHKNKYLSEHSKDALLRLCNTPYSFQVNNGNGVQLARYFYFSLSQNEDDVGMWERYTGNVGYNLSINLRGLLDSFEHSYPNPVTVYHGRIMYEREKQFKKFSDYIVDYIVEQESRKNKSYFSFPLIDQEVQKRVRICMLFMKNPFFKSEQEYRVVLACDPYDDNQHFPFKCKKKSGLLVPYKEVNCPRSCIRSITSGPSLEKELVEDTLWAYVRKEFKGLSIPVKHSEGLLRQQ